MKINTNIIFFIIFTLFLTGVIFLIDTFLNSEDLENHFEEQHIDQSLFSSKEEKKENIEYIEIARNIIKEQNKEEKTDNKNNSPIIPFHKGEEQKLEKEIKKINFAFIPNTFKKDQEINKIDIGETLHNNAFYSFLKEINVLFYEKQGDVRGKMKNKQVKIFGPQYMDKDEIISIFIHEFAHYIDIYSLDRKKGEDISDQFYNISWYSTKTIKSGLKQKDFVSGYSMTNKYEDFAESLTYYILHNKDFLEKSKSSSILRKKYNFFNLIIFKSEIFKNTDFSKDNKVKDYYRDITKIDFSRKNFLQYLKKSI